MRRSSSEGGMWGGEACDDDIRDARRRIRGWKQGWRTVAPPPQKLTLYAIARSLLGTCA